MVLGWLVPEVFLTRTVKGAQPFSNCSVKPPRTGGLSHNPWAFAPKQLNTNSRNIIFFTVLYYNFLVCVTPKENVSLQNYVLRQRAFCFYRPTVKINYTGNK